eukprot:229060_1
MDTLIAPAHLDGNWLALSLPPKRHNPANSKLELCTIHHTNKTPRKLMIVNPHKNQKIGLIKRNKSGKTQKDTNIIATDEAQVNQMLLSIEM